MSRARIPVAVVVVALLWSLGATELTLSSGHVADAERTVALGLLVCWSFTLAGAVAWWRRPGHPFALLMMAAGLLSITGSLQGADNRWIFTAGLLFADIATGLYVQAILAYPEGRLPSRAARALVGVAFLLVTVGPLLQLLFVDTVAGCGGRCPENLLAVTDDPGVADAIDLATSLVGIAMGVGVVLLLLGRIRRASAPWRRALLPMLAASAVTAAFFIAHTIAEQFSEALGHDLSLGTMVTLALIPLAFLLGLLRSRLAGLSVRELLVQLGRGVEPGGLRDALARALRDPSLAVAYWLPAAGGWVDRAGEPFELPGPGSGRAVTEIEQEGRRVAALVHDPALLDEPGLLDAVGAATGLALANERLQAELRAYVHDLERERDFSNAIVGTVPSLLVVFDAAGRIIEFNQACEQLTGYRADEVRGRPLFGLLVPEDERAAVEAAVRSEELPNENENHWLTRSGERRLILWRNTAVLGPDGLVDFVIGGGIDITERKAQEAEVKAQRARIVEAADAERRRLERNLHDGAQQRLVSLSLTLRLARARVQEEPGAAEQLLDAAAEELSQALAELRELARGIHPAILTDRGLAPALDALVARTPLPVEVDDRLGGRLPGPVEALDGRLTVTSPRGGGTTIVAELPCAS